MRKCSYCDKEEKLTKEHIWPKCIVNRMPELEMKYLDIKQIVINSELIISDVCSDCNNNKLSVLDNYICSVYDRYFKYYQEKKKSFLFEYNYELLLRSLLKITYNSSRTVNKKDNEFKKYRKFIINGNEEYENIVIKLDIVTPSIINGKKVFPKSARCGTIDIGLKTDNFIIRMISINSFYFYILFSKHEFIQNEIVPEFREVFERIPGTIIHPYREKSIINQFSTEDTYTTHREFVARIARIKKNR